MDRRGFLGAALAGSVLRAQEERVLDTHLHLRANADECFTHMQGCGVTHAVLLTREVDEERARAEMEKRPGRFVRSVSTDPSLPDAAKTIRAAVRGGAVSIGELKYHVALNSAEMRRVYDIAAELDVPVMMHIQVFPHFAGETPYNTGYERFHEVLRAHPRTTFIGHGDYFWANISAEAPTDRGYPAGPVKRGGLSDRWLGEYANFYGDLSANSGNNALSRELDFSREFVARHRAKLIFGSDCSCTDGKGGGVSQNNNPEASRLAGKCVARETLGLLRKIATREVYRQLTWENGARLFRLPA